MTINQRFARQAQIEARRSQEACEIEACKLKLAIKHDLERNAKFDIAWRIAWDLGHSAGFEEVESYFGELVPLLKP